jgi:hypothetical protein
MLWKKSKEHYSIGYGYGANKHLRRLPSFFVKLIDVAATRH